MPFRLNPLYGTLDLVNGTGGTGTGNVTGFPPTTPQAIARWVDTAGTEIENSPGTLVQDGGGIEAQGFITNKLITETLHIGSNQTMITSGFSIELTGELIIDGDGELVVV